jgi:spore germination cell wall hydrolase CwlJ-like protein
LATSGLKHATCPLIMRKQLLLAAALILAPSLTFGGQVGSEQECLAEAMYFEARNQGWRGMLAVGVVIRNRVGDPRYPSDVCGVVTQGRYWKGNPVRHKCQFSYWCDGRPERPAEEESLTLARYLATMLLTKGLTIEGLDQATHYHAVYVSPSWAKTLVLVDQIGEHIFYEPKGR